MKNLTTDRRVMIAVANSMESATSRAHGELKRGLNGLATIGATAPFVGLFGTVIGIIDSFKGTTATPATTISVAAGGIAEALVTTGLGLLVAVPAVWAYNWFSHRLESYDLEMKWAAEATSAYLSGFWDALNSASSERPARL